MFIKIVNILLVIVVIILAGSICYCTYDVNKMEDEYERMKLRVNEMQAETESIRSFLEREAGDLPFIIADIQYTDRSDADDYFYEIKTQGPCSSLYFRAYFIALEKIEDLWLTFRLLDRYGNSVYPGQHGTCHMKFPTLSTGWHQLTTETSWGNGRFQPGKYRYEISYKDRVIASKNVIIHADEYTPESSSSSNDDSWY